MDLSRALRKFVTTEVLSWDSTHEEWNPSGVCGSLQVFDRFITERSFGQKKRILTTDCTNKLPTDVTTVKLRGSEEVFLVEKFNEDVRFNSTYGYTYLIHEAAYLSDLCESATTTNAAGVETDDGENVLEKLWVDIGRFTGAPSKAFEETEYTVVTITLPTGALADTDHYLKLVNGDRYNIDEIYSSLDLIEARGKRIG